MIHTHMMPVIDHPIGCLNVCVQLHPPSSQPCLAPSHVIHDCSSFCCMPQLARNSSYWVTVQPDGRGMMTRYWTNYSATNGTHKVCSPMEEELHSLQQINQIIVGMGYFGFGWRKLILVCYTIMMVSGHTQTVYKMAFFCNVLHIWTCPCHPYI